MANISYRTLNRSQPIRMLYQAGLVGLMGFCLAGMGYGSVSAQGSGPAASFTAPLSTPAAMSITPAAPVAGLTAEPTASSLAVVCTCSSDLFACSNFPYWSAAQACFNQCRITVGFDIHGLDEDGDGIACELPSEGPSPFTLPALPREEPSSDAFSSTVKTVESAEPTPRPAVAALPAPSMVTTTTVPAVLELPAYDAGDGVASVTPAQHKGAAEGTGEQPAPVVSVLPWMVTSVVVAAAGVLIAWLRGRLPQHPK